MNYKIFTVMLLAAALFSSCGLNRMVRNYDQGVRYTPATNPLENHGGEVAAEVQGTISEGYFLRRAMLEVTPVLVYEGGEQELPSVILRGTRTTAQGQMVNRDQTTNFNMSGVIEYQPEMEESELFIRARLYREGREDRATNLPERKVADGVIVTAQRVDNQALTVSYAPHGYEIETIITQRADLYFAYMRSDINMRLPLNRDQAAQARMRELEEFIMRGWQIRNIEINAWASPEGEIAFNERLSQNRSTAGQRFFTDMIRRLNRQHRITIEHPAPQVNARGEDFDGFMVALEASNLPDKQAIANVINSQLAPAERERRIRDMTVIYGEIEAILAPLRRAEFVIHSYEPKRPTEEIARLSTSNPSELSPAELLYSATLTDNMQTRLQIFRSAQEVYPRDYRGFNNAAALLIEMGEVDQAAQALERANQLQPNNGYVQNNLAIIAMNRQDIESARSLFEASANQGVNTSYNLGVVMIQEGNYQGALNAFNGVTCDYHLALAQLMTGNIQAASNTLNCAPESAQVHYLKAVIGARQNNTNMMLDGLRRAIQLDSEYAEIARRDREFVRYFNNDQFQNVVR